MFEIATENNLIHVIYSVILEIDKDYNILSDRQRQWIQINAKGSLIPELKKFYMISRLAKASREKGIKFVFFKGVVLADLYPQYVERVSSDSDIFVEEKDREASEEILRSMGYVIDKDDSKNNVKVYNHTNQNHMVELHTKLWEEIA